MKESKDIIPGYILSLDSFRRDLEALLGLSEEQLLQLDSIADSPDGFSTDVQTVKFAEQASLPFDKARASLSVAGYFYRRCREDDISSDDAIRQLSKIASMLGIDISGKESALRRLLALKDSYETGRYAESRAVDVGNHFMNVDGAWDIRPVFHRETDEMIKKVLVLLLNLRWHDTTGTQDDIVLQLNEDDWRDFSDKIKELEQQYEATKNYLEKG